MGIPSPASAKPHGPRPDTGDHLLVGVMGLRTAKAGTVSAATVAKTNSLLWQAAKAAKGVTPVPEPAVVAALEAKGGALATCQDDRCMASLGAAAGLDRVE